MEPCTFLHAEKILYTLRNRNLDKFLIFSQKKAVLMFREVTFRAWKMKKKKTLSKKLIFEETVLLNPKLKKLLFFSGEALRVFHHCFFICFHFTIDFTIALRCFHCWLHFLTSPLFVQVFLLHHWFSDCFFECFHFTNFLYHDGFFARHFVFVLLYRECYGCESFFYSQAFFTLYFFSTFGTTCFYQVFPGASSSTLKVVAGPPTGVRNTGLPHLFVWITQCLAKGISWLVLSKY